MIVAAKLVMLAVWMGAATSKLNLHFPFVVATMMSNNPLLRAKWMKRMFFRKFPDDLLPGRIPKCLAHTGTLIEFGVPLVLFFSRVIDSVRRQPWEHDVPINVISRADDSPITPDDGRSRT